MSWRGNETTVSPSVCAASTGNRRTSSPSMWIDSDALYVTTGSASSGAGLPGVPSAAEAGCSRRQRSWSRAKIVAPSLAKLALPPTWSGCTCVSTRKRIGLSETRRIAATSLSVSGANCESTSRMPSGPASTLMRPPRPSSVQKSGASCVVLISTLL